MTKAESLKLCVLTIAERKYVFLVQLRNWNYATSSSIRLDLLLLDTSTLLVKGDWMFKWIPTYNADSTYVFSEEETESWKPIPTKPVVPMLKTLHDSHNPSRGNMLHIRGNLLIKKEALSIEMVDIPVFKLRASVIRIGQNYRFLATMDDYREVEDYIHKTSLLMTM
uniref:Uncharacterized protein n=1 Tax=Pithovirus LCPAC304 TaxID=2506594 RepID=A0A481Z7H8_9VIRU|nr:MAG: hypothetical protein LCPAC304_01670 [Pithovirus LCPAC304]